MWGFHRTTVRLARTTVRGAMLSALVFAGSGYMAIAQTTTDTPGRVAFDLPDLPPATVEIDLGHGLIRHSLSLGDAAIAGFLDGLMTSPEANSSENAKFVAEQLTSARELGDAVSEVLHEVHVRVWDNLPQDSKLAEQVLEHFDGRLNADGWEPAVRVRDDDDMVRVFVQRSEDSLGGVLVVVADGNDLVVANLVGDLSPEKVQHLTATATKIGVRLGLDKEINRAVEQMRHEIERHGH